MNTPKPGTTEHRERRQRRHGNTRVAAVAALTTGLASLIVPMGGVSHAATGNKNYDCGKSYGAIARSDWSANFDIASPGAVYVNSTVPLALTNSVVRVPSNEGALWPGSYGGNFQVPMSFNGTNVVFTGSATGQWKAGGADTAFNGTASWVAPATPGDVPVTVQNFSWATNRNDSYTFHCAGTSNPKPYAVTTMVVKSRSHTSTNLSTTESVYRGDARPTEVSVGVDGGTVAGTARITVGEGVAAKTVTGALSGGKAVVALPTDLAPGEYPVKSEFLPAENAHYDGSSTSSTLVVLEPEETRTSTAVPALAFAQEATTVDVEVATTDAGSVAGAPVGTVRVSVDGKDVAVPVTAADNGRITVTLPLLEVGTHPVVSTFTPSNGNRFVGSTAAPANLVVRTPAAVTSTKVTLEHAEIQTSQRGQVQVVVSAPGTMPRGQVELTVGTETLPARDLVNGLAEVELPTLAPGEYPVTARFLTADAVLYRASASAPVTLKVLADASATATTVTLPQGPLVPGAPGKVHVKVQGGASTPTGTVFVQVAGVEYPVVLNGGEGEVDLGPLATGDHPVFAYYRSADTNRHLDSQAPVQTLRVVAPLVTTTSLRLAAEQIALGDEVTAVATVDASATVSGNVDFTVDGVHVGSAPVVSDGTATVALRGLTVGNRTVVATFVPGAGQTASVSAPRTVGVLNRAAISLSAPAPVEAGASAQVHATVSYGQGTPAGTVTFNAGGQSVRAAVAADGTASATLPALASGTWSLTATFTSTDSLLQATANPVDLLVRSQPIAPPQVARATTTVVTLDNAAPVHGQRPVATATVTPVADGFVEFNVGGTIVSAPVGNGVATATLPVLEVGAATVTATFVPAAPAQFLGSRGTTGLTVAKVPTSTKVVVTGLKKAGTGKKGKAQVTATVTPAVAQTLSGTVTVTVTAPKKLAKKFRTKPKKVTRAVAANGVAQVKVGKLRKGKYTVTVTYSGSAHAAASTTVTKAKVK